MKPKRPAYATLAQAATVLADLLRNEAVASDKLGGYQAALEVVRAAKENTK